jgi:hypothetical protein
LKGLETEFDEVCHAMAAYSGNHPILCGTPRKQGGVAR